jgi:hypothetical protein
MSPSRRSRDRSYCDGTKRQGEPGTCHRPAGWGTPHPGTGRCKLHGGTLRGSVAAGSRDLLNRQARSYLAKYGVAVPVDNPVQKLSELAGECDALRSYFAMRVQQLQDPDFTSTTDLGVDQINALVTAYERALDRCAKVLTDMAKLNLDERLVRVSELQATALGASLDKVLANPRVGLDDAQRATVLNLLATELLT